MAEIKDEDIAKAKAEAAAAAKDNKKPVEPAKSVADEAKDIIAKAKAEAKAIVEAARKSSGDVVFKGVSAKQLISGYESGMSHMKLAEKFFGSNSEENILKVRSVIDPKFDIQLGIKANVEEIETED